MNKKIIIGASGALAIIAIIFGTSFGLNGCSNSNGNGGDTTSSGNGSTSKGGDSSSSSSSSSSTHTHTFGTTLEVITEATASKAGTKGYKCTECGSFDTEHEVQYQPYMDSFDWNKALFGDSTLADDAIDFSHDSDYTMELEGFQLGGTRGISDKYVSDKIQRYGKTLSKSESYESTMAPGTTEKSGQINQEEKILVLKDDGSLSEYYRGSSEDEYDLSSYDSPSYDSFRESGGEFNLKNLVHDFAGDGAETILGKSNFSYNSEKDVYAYSFTNLSFAEISDSSDDIRSGTVTFGFDFGKLTKLNFSYTCLRDDVAGNSYEIKATISHTSSEIIIPHVHDYGSAWKSDATNHWHECSADGAKSGEAPHTFGGKTLNLNDSSSKIVETCSVCGYENSNDYTSGSTIDRIFYGYYPQTHVSDQTTIDSLNDLQDPESNGWYLLNGEYYAKANGNPRGDFNFSDGTKIVSNTPYWFKCDPIEWKVYDSSNDEYSLVSTVLLEHRLFDGNFSTAYASSSLKTWLNGDFYNLAFPSGESRLQNKAIDDVNNKVYILKVAELMNTEYFADNGARQAKPSDYALANDADMNEGGNSGKYWTASPSSSGIYYVSNSGGIFNTQPDCAGVCVRPAITVKLS